jgi:hypothetical protein
MFLMLVTVSPERFPAGTFRDRSASNSEGRLTDSLLDGADTGSMTQGGAAWRKKLLRTSVC